MGASRLPLLREVFGAPPIPSASSTSAAYEPTITGAEQGSGGGGSGGNSSASILSRSSAAASASAGGLATDGGHASPSAALLGTLGVNTDSSSSGSGITTSNPSTGAGNGASAAFNARVSYGPRAAGGSSGNPASGSNGPNSGGNGNNSDSLNISGGGLNGAARGAVLSTSSVTSTGATNSFSSSYAAAGSKTGGGAAASTASVSTIAFKFKQQLGALHATLLASSPHYGEWGVVLYCVLLFLAFFPTTQPCFFNGSPCTTIASVTAPDLSTRTYNPPPPPSPHHAAVRCVKPNSQKASGLFTHPQILTQLRYAGVLETVRIRRQGYPYREDYPSFWRRAVRCGWGAYLAPKAVEGIPVLPPPRFVTISSSTSSGVVGMRGEGAQQVASSSTAAASVTATAGAVGVVGGAEGALGTTSSAIASAAAAASSSSSSAIRRVMASSPAPPGGNSPRPLSRSSSSFGGGSVVDVNLEGADDVSRGDVRGPSPSPVNTPSGPSDVSRGGGTGDVSSRGAGAGAVTLLVDASLTPALIEAARAGTAALLGALLSPSQWAQGSTKVRCSRPVCATGGGLKVIRGQPRGETPNLIVA